MKLVIDKKLANNNYEVTLTIDDIQESETELFNDFGQVSINIGGQLILEGEEAPVATLGDMFKYLPGDFPVTKVFTQAQYGVDAEKVANAFVDTVVSRIQDAITELKAKQDSFTGTTEVIL